MKPEVLTATVDALREALEDPHAQIKLNTNRKMGNVAHFSTLKGSPDYNDYTNGRIGVISGTCGNCEHCTRACYADSETRFPTVLIDRSANTALVKNHPERLTPEVVEFVKAHNVKRFRWNASGEIWDAIMLDSMIDIANACEGCEFFTYTKRFDLLEAYADAIPHNLHVSVSIWHNNYDNPLGFAEFIYDDGTQAELETVAHCPAVDRNGKKTGVTCSECGRCIRAPKGQKTAVYAH